MGIYLTQDRDAIVATLGLLKHFNAFLASPCKEMRDPYELHWRDGASRLDKVAARKKLTWLVNMAINRKAGILDHPLNHLGKPARRHDQDHQTHLLRDRNRLQDIQRRIRVYQFETPEVRSRFSHLLASKEDW